MSCGITKSIVYFYDGNIIKSLSYHLFGPLLVGFCLFIIVILAIELKTQKVYFRKWILNRKSAYCLVAVLFVYYCIRIILLVRQNTWDDILQQSIWK
jgi:hypothetical protein